VTGVKTEKSVLRVQFSQNRQKAFLLFQKEGDYSHLTESDVLLALSPFHVRITEKVKSHISQLLTLIAKGTVPAEPYLIAEGVAPVEPTNQEFAWDERYNQKDGSADDSDTFNFYEQNKIVTVEGNTVIGSIIPAQPGQNGLDVCGNTIKPVKVSIPIRLGENVLLDPDGKTLRATTSGQVIIQNHKVCVRRVLDIGNNVDFETGNIDSETDVCIRGSVRDLFIVKSKKDISVQGMVEAACLVAGGDIKIVGGVKGREKALIEAGGCVHAKFLNYVYLQSQGDVEICKESIDSTIICNGWLDIPNGSLIAGQAFGLKGADIKSIGSPVGVKTVVGVGMNPLVYQRILELEKMIKSDQELAQKIRSSVGPLLQQLKRLTAEQREKATELMFHADSLDMENKNKDDERKKLLETFPPVTDVELRVSGCILPNTQVFIGDKFTTIREEIRGPLKIVMRIVEGKKEMLLINNLTGSCRTLLAGKLDLDSLDIPKKPEIAQPGVKVDKN